MAETAEITEAGGSSKRKIVIIAIAALVVLGGGAAAFLLTGAEPQAAVDGAATTEAPKTEPIYIPLDPAFVVNFQDKNNNTKFLKADLNVVTFDASVSAAIEKHMPAIRNNLVLLFSRQLYEDLLPHEGKEALRAEALSQVQAVLEKQIGKPGIDDLFFTSFVMQ